MSELRKPEQWSEARKIHHLHEDARKIRGPLSVKVVSNPTERIECKGSVHQALYNFNQCNTY